MVKQHVQSDDLRLSSSTLPTVSAVEACGETAYTLDYQMKFTHTESRKARRTGKHIKIRHDMLMQGKQTTIYRAIP